MHLGHMADNLLESRVGERVELHFDNRPHAVDGHTHGHTDDPRLSQGRVEAALFAEGFHESVGYAEDTTQHADILAEDQDRIIRVHGIRHRSVQRLGHGYGLRSGFLGVCRSGGSSASSG